MADINIKKAVSNLEKWIKDMRDEPPEIPVVFYGKSEKKMFKISAQELSKKIANECLYYARVVDVQTNESWINGLKFVTDKPNFKKITFPAINIKEKVGEDDG